MHYLFRFHVLLSKLSNLGLDIGLYRDDGLAVCDFRPRQAEIAKKKLCRIFRENGFSITVQANMKSVNFLDVNFNLDLDIFKPYMKPNGAPVYVHHDSNHPRGILKNIPQSINRSKIDPLAAIVLDRWALDP